MRQEARMEVTNADHTHSDDGVDLTLVRWMLSLTPAERLEAVQSYARAILRARHARERA
jgi:hypothetical protein